MHITRTLDCGVLRFQASVCVCVCLQYSAEFFYVIFYITSESQKKKSNNKKTKHFCYFPHYSCLLPFAVGKCLGCLTFSHQYIIDCCVYLLLCFQPTRPPLFSLSLVTLAVLPLSLSLSHRSFSLAEELFARLSRYWPMKQSSNSHMD